MGRSDNWTGSGDCWVGSYNGAGSELILLTDIEDYFIDIRKDYELGDLED